jgi:hypothetical protein
MSKKKRASTPKAQLKYQYATTIVIGSGNTISMPEPIVTFRKGPVVWIVENDDGEQHKVSIAPEKMTKRGTTTKKHPFKDGTSAFETTVHKKDAEVIVARTHTKPNEQYKYVIDSYPASGGTPQTLDPDLDVDDPPPLVP